MKYEEWLQSTCQDAMKKLLRTVDKIIDEADDKMTGTEIDHIKDCFNAISMAHYLMENHEHHHDCHAHHDNNVASSSTDPASADMTNKLALRT